MKFLASILLKVKNGILGPAASPVMVLDWIGNLRLLIIGNADRDRIFKVSFVVIHISAAAPF